MICNLPFVGVLVFLRLACRVGRFVRIRFLRRLRTIICIIRASLALCRAAFLALFLCLAALFLPLHHRVDERNGQAEDYLHALALAVAALSESGIFPNGEQRLLLLLFGQSKNRFRYGRRHKKSVDHKNSLLFSCALDASRRFLRTALVGQAQLRAFPTISTTLYQTQKLTFKVIRTFAFSPQTFYPIYFIINFYFFFYFFFYFYLEKKKGCGEEEEGGTQCFTRLISP